MSGPKVEPKQGEPCQHQLEANSTLTVHELETTEQSTRNPRMRLLLGEVLRVLGPLNLSL